VDLCILTLGQPARERLSTRIVIVNYTDAGGNLRMLGLIAEHATEMMRRDEREFVDPGVRSNASPYLGPLIMDDKGVIQLLRAEHLLAENLRELLVAAPHLDHDAH
jgi:chemotaxis-related protein WspB